MLRLYGAPQGRLAAAVALFALMEAEAQWKPGRRDALAVNADTPMGHKGGPEPRSSFGADVYGAGDTSQPLPPYEALEA